MRAEMKRLLWAALAAFFIASTPASAAEIEDLNTTDASNTARFAENQSPGSLNDGMRALEGIIARWHEDTGCRKATTGSADAYIFAAARTLSAYYDGLTLCLEIHATNTGASTINVDSIGVKNILKHGDDALAVGDLVATFKYLLVYDGAAFQLLSALAVPPALTGFDNNFSSDQTLVSTNTGATEGPGLDLFRDSATPADADIGGVLRFKMEDDSSTATTMTKISVVADDVTNLTEDGHLRIDTRVAGTLNSRWHVGNGIWADGNSNPGAGKIDADEFLTSGTALPFQSGTFEGTDTSIAAGDLTQFTHSLGAIPKLFQAFLKCTSAELGFAVDDEINVSSLSHVYRLQTSGGPTEHFGVTVWADATTVDVKFATDGIELAESPGGTENANLDLSKWDLIVRAWR